MENSEKIYESLLLQYESLSDIEKNAILIYKSNLYIIINSITKVSEYEKLTIQQLNEQLPNKDECISVFNSYSKNLNDLKNSFIKNTVFSNIRFDNFNNFITDLKIIIDVLNKISFKIILEEDLVVYRGIRVDKDKKFDFINDSPSLISTSIKIEDAEKFLDSDNNKENHLYSIKLSKGIPVVVSPFSIVRKYDSVYDSFLPDSNYSLVVSNRGINGQQEIILFKDYISYQEISNKTIDDEFGRINLHSIEISLKEDVYLNNQVNLK